jgi:hypothetical protein
VSTREEDIARVRAACHGTPAIEDRTPGDHTTRLFWPLPDVAGQHHLACLTVAWEAGTYTATLGDVTYDLTADGDLLTEPCGHTEALLAPHLAFRFLPATLRVLVDAARQIAGEDPVGLFTPHPHHHRETA